MECSNFQKLIVISYILIKNRFHDNINFISDFQNLGCHAVGTRFWQYAVSCLISPIFFVSSIACLHYITAWKSFVQHSFNSDSWQQHQACGTNHNIFFYELSMDLQYVRICTTFLWHQLYSMQIMWTFLITVFLYTNNRRLHKQRHNTQYMNKHSRWSLLELQTMLW